MIEQPVAARASKPGFLTQAGFYAKYLSRRWILRRSEPLVLGLSVTDCCNLHCLYCTIANLARTMMPADEVERRLRQYHARGFRELYITGGEPLLWHDGRTRLADIIELAYSIGYFHVGLTTNGTCPLYAPADVIWVSLDGTREVHGRLRGPHFDQILENLRASDHPGVGITCTVNAWNRTDLKGLLQLVLEEQVAPLGVMFYFLTPYYGRDELFLDRKQRAAVIDELLAYKRNGLPVFNSPAALKCLRSGRWQRPNNLWWLSDEDGEHMCCRHRKPEICEECGYSSCVEIIEALRLRPSAVRALMKMN